MSSNKKFICPLCREKFTSLSGIHDHINEDHSESIPPGYDAARYYYYLLTEKTSGKCIVCGKPTNWNPSTNKYKRFCEDPKCKQEYRKTFEKRMFQKHGKVSLLNDPDHQRKMLASRSISGKYEWSDGTFKTYTGTYEKDFAQMLDVFMNFDSDDVEMPSPHTYEYIYQGEKKFYIPDAYIYSLNLEIEIKESDNMHHKIQAVDRVKEKLKDDVLLSQKNVHYIKILDKKYDDFFKYLMKRKEDFKDINKVDLNNKPVKESCSDIVTEVNYLKNSDDIYFNYDNFLNNKSNMLFITGLSGSGKSTLAKQLTREYDAIYIELDLFCPVVFEHILNNKQYRKPIDARYQQIILEYINTKLKKYIKLNSKKEYIFDYKPWYSIECVHFIEYITKKLYMDKHRYIIDGFQIFEDPDMFDIIKAFPVIVKSTPALTSYIRMRKREGDTLLGVLHSEVVKNKLDRIPQYNNMLKSVNLFIDKMDVSLSESYIFSKKDEFINIDSWKPGKDTNALYITGLSGSGKTSLTYNIARHYNANVIGLDHVFGHKDLLEIDDIELPPGLKIIKKFYSNPANLFDTTDKSIFIKNLKKFMNYMMDYMSHNPNKLFIIEGIDIYLHPDIFNLKDKPVVIKNTSTLKSFYRAHKRERYQVLLSEIEWYMREEKTLNKFVKTLTESSIDIIGRL